MKDKRAEFLRNFTNCSDVESLRRVTAEAGVDLRVYSRLAFRKLLEAKQPIESLLQFLQDPALNDPKAKNLRYFLRWQSNCCARDTETSTVIYRLAPWIKMRLRLWTMTRDDFEHLAMLLSSVARNTQSDALVLLLGEAIVKGLDECRVMSISDLQGSTVQVILDSLFLTDLTERKAALIYKVFEDLQKSQLQCMSVNLERLLIETCRMYVRLQTNGGTTTTSLDLDREFTRILRIVPNNMKAHVIDRTTLGLMEDAARNADDRVIWSTVLKIWYFNLVECGLFSSLLDGNKKTYTPRFIGHENLFISMPYLRHLDDKQLSLHLLRHWWRAPRYLQKKYTQELYLDEPFTPMLKLAQDHLPGSLNSQLIGKFFKILQLMRRHDTILEIVRRDSRQKSFLPPHIISSLVETYASISLSHARRMFLSCPGLLMEHCPTLAERMIDDIGVETETLWRYLRNRRPLKMPKIRFQQWRENRARLLERMAHRYAKAKHLSPRIAFRCVYTCYIHHMKDRLGPVGKSLSRSITRTGLIRPLQRKQRVSSVKLRWILSIVKATEGHDVAGRLDWLAYKWSKEQAPLRQLTERLDKLCDVRYGPMLHRIQHRWSKRMRTPVKVFTPTADIEIPTVKSR